ncbi:MAG: PP2C family protein-serine/threonine phosphatase [Gracilimonas sp.]|uniref:PP2C family protein-serine/threonine phosphatase n=1 Tax=Gracilimonas TaxID=649462 RepID=UPI001AFE363D|nr:PP2C family protein-serine/threonine phosphatase [Gracilimonas sp.]MBO6587322.1 PP2C family protein-serine/threonine phosphatase [Gracilimonas sp.]MBO6614190.1 PP2C family protein-serine/threonine phosphatase [Gracilimonas sp.]
MQQSKKLFRDVLIFLFGVAGIGWFFYSFQNHHPFTITHTKVPKGHIIEKADSVFQSWQYQALDFYPQTEFNTEEDVIDSLQVKWGISEFKNKLRESEFLQNLPLAKWEVREYNLQSENNDYSVEVGLTPDGKVVDFLATTELINQQRPFNRYAVRTVFQNQVDNYSRGLEDSLLTGLSDYQHLNTESGSNSQALTIIERLREIRGTQDERVYEMSNIWNLADFYLGRTAWRSMDLQPDTAELVDQAGLRFARATYSASDSATGVNVELTMELLPAGSMKSMAYRIYPRLEESSSKVTDILEGTSLFVILVFALWLLFVFYLRIKARAIDTKPAIIIAVLAGFLVPGFWLLNFIDQMGWMYGFNGSVTIFQNLMMLGIMGAIGAVGFFVLTAVSDSITRQYWPEKLKTWDLVRRGLFMNKPVGWGMVNAIAIGGILVGIVGLFLSVFDTTYISANTGLMSDDYFLPSIANLMVTTLFVLMIVVPLYLIIGNQIKGMVGRDWIIPIVSAVLFALIDLLPFNIEPDELDRLLRGVLGFVLGYFYLRYDFLTIVFGAFLFVNFLTTSKGWLLEGSPDANTFYMFMMVLLTFAVGGIYFVFKGTERDELPEYVPGYIEDQAKEQRLKQELSIARVVQQTFLPSKIHHLPGIDIAGICIPAQETGGDYYDMISLGDQRTALAIGDVSGKGIRAAFYMTFTKGVLHSLSALILSPVELLNQLNRLFNENATRGTFISMIYGILEADKRQFTFARAGHNPMLVVRANGDTEWLKPNGVGIGVAQKAEAFIKCTEEATLKLKEGDVVIMYTDGITEMLNAGNHFYGEERLERLVKGVRKASSEKIMEIIVDDVNEFKGVVKQHDDMTLLIIKADASVNQ